MSGALGGGYSNDGFDLVKPLRKLFDGMDERRREQVRINTEHSMATQRAAQAHAYNMELFHAQAYENASRDAARFDHERGLLGTRLEAEGQQRLAQRTFEYTKMDLQRADAAVGREHEVRMERERGRQSRATAKANARLTRENYDHAAASSGPSKPVSASPTSMSGSTAPAKRTPAKKATAAKKATKPATPRKPKA
jgi:hypothetical protein